MLGPMLKTLQKRSLQREKWQKRFYQGESEQPKNGKILENIKWELEGGKCR